MPTHLDTTARLTTSRVSGIAGGDGWPCGRRALFGLVLGVAVVVGVLRPYDASAADRTLTGVVRTLAADTVNRSSHPPAFRGHSEDVYRQVLDTGTRAYFLPRGTKLRPNARVRVVGRVSGTTLRVSSVTTTGTVQGLSPSGTTRVLVMLASWQGAASDSTTPADMSSQMFSDTSAWYRDASYGRLTQTGTTVTPWLSIPAPTTGCYADAGTLMSDAKNAAEQYGYDLTQYDNFVLYFPHCDGDAAGYAGWAYVGAPNVWLNGYHDRRVTVHEQGHNYGLWHSHSYMCTGGGLSGSCSFSDYGDLYDAMGSSGYVGHFNASQKTLLGWMSGRTVDLSAGGTTTLAPMASSSTANDAAVVRMPSGRKYWVEYRQPIGFDSWLPASGTNGVLVHVSGAGSGSSDSGASVIDVRPSDGISESTATLRSGETWTSDDSVTFSVGAVNALGATVTVRTGSKADIALVGGSGWASVPVAFSQGNGAFSVTNVAASWFASVAQTSGAEPVAGDFNGT